MILFLDTFIQPISKFLGQIWLLIFEPVSIVFIIFNFDDNIILDKTSIEIIFSPILLITEVNEAISTFHKLRKIDPYRLDNMDTLSNLLYVKEMRVELAFLAHHASEIDKYRVETCCVIGKVSYH